MNDWQEFSSRYPQRAGTFPVNIHLFDNEEDVQHFAKGGSVGALAEDVRRHGRGEDSVLIHVNPEELEQLRGQWGTPTINPHTGLPEFGFWKSLGKAAIIAAGFAIGGPSGAAIAAGAVAGAGSKGPNVPDATVDTLLTDRQKDNFNSPLSKSTAAWNPTVTPAQGAALSYDDWIKKLGEGREQQWVNPTFTFAPKIENTPATVPTVTDYAYKGKYSAMNPRGEPNSSADSRWGIPMAQGGFVGGQMPQPPQQFPRMPSGQNTGQMDPNRMPIPSRNDPSYQQFLEQMMQGNKRPAGALSEVRMSNGGALGYSEGGGSGRDDKIPAKLSNNEYVMDAESVAMLGDGSSGEGAKRLDRMRENLRKHKGAALAKGKFSPDAKPPLSYL